MKTLIMVKNAFRFKANVLNAFLSTFRFFFLYARVRLNVKKIRSIRSARFKVNLNVFKNKCVQCVQCVQEVIW